MLSIGLSMDFAKNVGHNKPLENECSIKFFKKTSPNSNLLLRIGISFNYYVVSEHSPKINRPLGGSGGGI